MPKTYEDFIIDFLTFLDSQPRRSSIKNKIPPDLFNEHAINDLAKIGYLGRAPGDCAEELLGASCVP